MSCCGQTKRIIINTAGHVAETRLGIKGKKSPYYEARKQTCRECEFNTWMKTSEYFALLAANGIKVLQNFTQLEKLDRLPKQNTGRNLYCRICKCFVPGKARTNKKIEDMEKYEKCPKGFWKN